jgi:diaminopimelate decarboxylase
MIKTLSQAIDLSLKAKSSREIDTNLKIEIEGQLWTAYTVAISYRDILFYCDKGTATFLVDSYGDKNVAELFDWEFQNETN